MPPYADISPALAAAPLLLLIFDAAHAFAYFSLCAMLMPRRFAFAAYCRFIAAIVSLDFCRRCRPSVFVYAHAATRFIYVTPCRCLMDTRVQCSIFRRRRRQLTRLLPR